MMIFELTDLLKEKITVINEGVLNHLDKIEEASSLKNMSKEVHKADTTNLNYTPVTHDTFAAWCEKYKERIRLEKLANKSDLDDKPTGKQLFLMNRSAFDDIVLDATEAEAIEAIEDGAATVADEEAKVEEEEDEDDEAFVYDRALYDADGLDDDEDIDFDD
mmetsp:Transcript_14908/g.20204  ORF Transcript_14908/g.20204 Transcript_14908/m.20204 type:complete len:162 (+) Transcript_14908:366-851(+)